MRQCKHCKTEKEDNQFHLGNVCKACNRARIDVYDKTRRKAKFHGNADGRGALVWPNGDMFHGHFRGGKRHGAGLYTFADGTTQEGVWHHNQLEVVEEENTRVYRRKPPGLYAAAEDMWHYLLDTCSVCKQLQGDIECQQCPVHSIRQRAEGEG